MGITRQGRLAIGVVLLVALVGVGASRAEEDCLCRDIQVTCEFRPSSTALVGSTLEFCATVTNVGTYDLEEVRLAMRLCEGASLVPGAEVGTTVPRLAVGETYTHCVRFVPTVVGDCTVVAHAQDNTRIAAAACVCTARIEGLPAIQLRMIDLAADGSPQGVFNVGEEFIYRLSVEEDMGSAVVQGLRVRWSLPPQLEFVRGAGDRGQTVLGSGQACESSVFNLAAEEVQTFDVVCRVVDVAAGNLVRTKAYVVSAVDETMLAEEDESTTLRR